MIGRRVVINDAPYEIVGVMPDGFRGLGVTPPDYWAPLALAGQSRRRHCRTRRRDRHRGHRAAEDRGGRPRQRQPPLSVWASGRADFDDTPPGVRSRSRSYRARARCRRVAPGLHIAFYAAVLRLRADPDDRLRQRRQPAARARRLAPAGDRHSPVAWRVTPAHHPAAAHGEPPSCARGRGMRSGRLAAVSGGCALCGDRPHYRRISPS